MQKFDLRGLMNHPTKVIFHPYQASDLRNIAIIQDIRFVVIMKAEDLNRQFSAHTIIAHDDPDLIDRPDVDTELMVVVMIDMGPQMSGQYGVGYLVNPDGYCRLTAMYGTDGSYFWIEDRPGHRPLTTTDKLVIENAITQFFGIKGGSNDE